MPQVQILSALAIIYALSLTCAATLNAQTRFEVVGDMDLKGKLKLFGDAGVNGQVLTSNGAAAAPHWSTLSSSSCPVGGQFISE